MLLASALEPVPNIPPVTKGFASAIMTKVIIIVIIIIIIVTIVIIIVIIVSIVLSSYS